MFQFVFSTFPTGEEDELIKPSKSRIPRPSEKLRKFQKLGQLLQSGDKGSKGDEPNPPSPQHVSIPYNGICIAQLTYEMHTGLLC